MFWHRLLAVTTVSVSLFVKSTFLSCLLLLRTYHWSYVLHAIFLTDLNYSSRASWPSQPAPLTTSIDSLVVYVLSKKEKPLEVANRVDDFLLNFKSRLEEMSSEEIKDYADSLAKELTKPIRKLGDEASKHMAKIRRYAPEVLMDDSGSADDLPWDSPEVLSEAVR